MSWDIGTEPKADDDMPGIVYVRRDGLRHLAELIRDEGRVLLHCSDWSCGQMTVLPLAHRAWVCPVHGGTGVEP